MLTSTVWRLEFFNQVSTSSAKQLPSSQHFQFTGQLNERGRKFVHNKWHLQHAHHILWMLYKSGVYESGTMQENMYEINRRNRGAKTLATHLDDKK